MSRQAARATPLVYMLAGEPSGDAIGALLMAALRREYGAPLRFAGVGGSRMTSAGLRSLFPMSDLTVMGFAELVPALPRLAMRLLQTVLAVRADTPHMVVGIDSKGFNLRVLRHLSSARRSRTHMPSAADDEQPTPILVQYVAPSAWAFADATQRAARLAETVRLDELLVLLPFEAPLYQSAGIRCTFVGHPALEPEVEGAQERFTHGDSSPKRLPHGGSSSDDVSSTVPPLPPQASSALCLLPGSRPHEIEANLPLMLQAAELIAVEVATRFDRSGSSAELSAQVTPSTGIIDHLLLPVPLSLRDAVEAHLRARPPGSLRAQVLQDSERHRAYAHSRLAIACCGTVNVELARARVPQVAVYRSSRLTSWFVRHILRPSTPYATLPNILQGLGQGRVRAAEGQEGVRRRIPELLFEACTAEAIAREVVRLLRDPREAQGQVDAASDAVGELVTKDEDGRVRSPATVAARALLRHLPPVNPSVAQRALV